MPLCRYRGNPPSPGWHPGIKETTMTTTPTPREPNQTVKLTGGVVSPAYGRDYVSGKQAREDFLAGKDFVLHSPYGETYCSIRDFAPGAQVEVRFKRFERTTIVEVQ